MPEPVKSNVDVAEAKEGFWSKLFALRERGYNSAPASGSHAALEEQSPPASPIPTGQDVFDTKLAAEVEARKADQRTEQNRLLAAAEAKAAQEIKRIQAMLPDAKSSEGKVPASPVPAVPTQSRPGFMSAQAAESPPRPVDGPAQAPKPSTASDLVPADVRQAEGTLKNAPVAPSTLPPAPTRVETLSAPAAPNVPVAAQAATIDLQNGQKPIVPAAVPTPQETAPAANATASKYAKYSDPKVVELQKAINDYYKSTGKKSPLGSFGPDKDGVDGFAGKHTQTSIRAAKAAIGAKGEKLDFEQLTSRLNAETLIAQEKGINKPVAGIPLPPSRQLAGLVDQSEHPTLETKDVSAPGAPAPVAAQKPVEQVQQR